LLKQQELRQIWLLKQQEQHKAETELRPVKLLKQQEQH
jgi:hypothetical protein